MKSIITAGILGALLSLSAASCSHSNPTPEGFCQSWVSSSCAALATCCTAGTSYDADQCQVSLSGQCQQALAVDMVQAGERIFDSGAAAACFGSVTACAASGPSQAGATYAETIACANVITGYVPIGAACTADDQCQRSGDASTCYGGGGTTGGVCATMVLGSATCSFSFASNLLVVCPDDTFCDRTAATPDPKATPEQQAYEFTAPCKPYLAAGASCATTAGQTESCGAGLYCDFTKTMPTCTAVKTVNQTCTGNDCAPGLECEPSAGAAGQTCQQAGGEFCFTPCGQVGEPCCAGATPCTGGTCQAGVCAAGSCGDIGESCCNGVSCNNGSCQGGICASSTCGDIGETCCNGVTCNTGSCQGGICLATPDCSCACTELMSAGGCADVCSTLFDGASTPNFCEGQNPLNQCESCILTHCSGLSLAAGTCTGM